MKLQRQIQKQNLFKTAAVKKSHLLEGISKSIRRIIFGLHNSTYLFVHKMCSLSIGVVIIFYWRKILLSLPHGIHNTQVPACLLCYISLIYYAKACESPHILQSRFETFDVMTLKSLRLRLNVYSLRTRGTLKRQKTIPNMHSFQLCQFQEINK